METETGAESALPDLPEKIDTAVGNLTMVAARLRLVEHAGAQEDAVRVDAAMLLLAELQEVVSWEPDRVDTSNMRSVADALMVMTQIQPRPPAVVMLLSAASAHLRTAEDRLAATLVSTDPVQDARALVLGMDVLAIQRDAYDVAKQAMELGRRLGGLHMAVVR